MVPGFDGKYICDHEFRISLLRDPSSSDHLHVFLLLEGFVDPTVGFPTLNQNNENKSYKIYFIDFTHSEAIRILSGNNLQDIINNGARISSSGKTFEKISKIIKLNQAVNIYQMIVKQQAIQGAQNKNNPNYIHYFLNGGTYSSYASHSSDEKIRHNCLSWAIETLKANEINLDRDEFTLLQRLFLKTIAYPPVVFNQHFKEHRTLINTLFIGGGISMLGFGVAGLAAKLGLFSGSITQLPETSATLKEFIKNQLTT